MHSGRVPTIRATVRMGLKRVRATVDQHRIRAQGDRATKGGHESHGPALGREPAGATGFAAAVVGGEETFAGLFIGG